MERRGKPAVHLLYGTDPFHQRGKPALFSAHLDYRTGRTLLAERKNLAFFPVTARICAACTWDRAWISGGTTITTGFLPGKSICRCAGSRRAVWPAWPGASAPFWREKSREEALESARIWEDIGVGFQIADDITNLVTGNPGKDRGDDIVEGKKSLPVILHYAKAPETREELTACFNEARERGISEGKAAVERAIELIDGSGVPQRRRRPSAGNCSNRRWNGFANCCPPAGTGMS